MIPDKYNICHLFYCPFTGLGLHDGYRGDLWMKNRIEIFKKYTLKSILNQTNRNIINWISFREKDKDNPLVLGLIKHLKSLRDYNYAFTFGGVCFWDDKYPNDNLKERLEKTLPALKETIAWRKYVYMTIQPSDDMYMRDMAEKIQCEDFKENKAVGYLRGYILNSQTDQLAEYNPTTTPPFYTIMFTKEDFLDPEKHFELVKNLKSHEYIRREFDFFPYSDPGFCVLVHGENISTTWDISYKGREIKGNEKEAILERFGIYDILKKNFLNKLKQKLSRQNIKMAIIRSLPVPIQRIAIKIYKKYVYKKR